MRKQKVYVNDLYGQQRNSLHFEYSSFRSSTGASMWLLKSSVGSNKNTAATHVMSASV